MYFLNPGALWALFLILIPILIHLFNLRRIKKVYFSNLRFLKDVSQQQKSRTTLKKLLILLSRILAISFLVLAFSRPILTTNETYTPVKNPLIYLDNSLSLQRTDESGNLLLINGITSVSNFLSTLPRGLDVGYLTNDKQNLKWERQGEVSQKILEVDYSYGALTLGEVFEKMNRLQGDQLFIFSDFQRSTSLGIENIFEDTTKNITLFKLSSPVEKNLYVDSVYLSEPLNVSSENQLNVLLKNTSSESISDALVKVNKEGTQLASFTVNLDSKTTKRLTLDLSANMKVTGQYQVELEDSPVVFDNIFYFTISQTIRPKVVLLSQGQTNPYLANVYANKEFFELHMEDVSNASFQNIIDADLLVLDHLPSIPDWLLSQVNQVKGKILVTPPSEIDDLRSYSSLLGFQISQSESEVKVPLDIESFTNPFFNDVFLAKDDRMGLPEVIIDFNVSGYHEPIIFSNTGFPFLMRNNKIHFFSSDFSSTASFPKHAIFVPVMYKLAQQDAIERLYYRLGERSLTLKLDSINADDLVTLSNNQNSFVLPVRFDRDGVALSIPDVMNEPGFYSLSIEGDTLKNLAFNYSKAESEIESIDFDELQAQTSGYGHISLQEISGVQDYGNSVSQDQESQSLWKYALFLSLIFLITELALLRFIK